MSILPFVVNEKDCKKTELSLYDSLREFQKSMDPQPDDRVYLINPNSKEYKKCFNLLLKLMDYYDRKKDEKGIAFKKNFFSSRVTGIFSLQVKKIINDVELYSVKRARLDSLIIEMEKQFTLF